MAQISPHAVEQLEFLCMDDWRAKESVTYWGWHCRVRDGQSLRANCIMPLEWDGAGRTAAEEIQRCAGWMRSRGVRPVFKLADGCVHPPDLPAALAQAGYAPRHETLVMTRSLEWLAAPETEVRLSAKPSDAFFGIMEAAAVSPEDHAERRAIVNTMIDQTVFAVAFLDGAPAAIGLCRHSGYYAGVYLMRTAPHARRRGMARDVLRALCAWARWHAAQCAFLQVEEENEAAVALYANDGFELAYRYRYWTQD